MSSKILILGLVVVVVVSLGIYFLAVQPDDELEPGPGPGTEAPLVLDDSGATDEIVAEVVRANNQFALEFYKEIKEDGENLFFSPYSISTALAMTYEGAKGKTADEMADVFGFSIEDSTRQFGFAKIQNQLNKQDKEYELNTANALWAQEDYPFLAEYLGLVEKYYGGKTTNFDFVNQAEQASQTINAWVEEKTNNKIKDLIPEGVLNAMTRLVLTNAIYFKGTWLTQFAPEETNEQDFKVSETETVKAEMMQLVDTDEKFNYFSDEEVEVLELPYTGEDLSMFILLPRENDIAGFEEAISLEKIEQWQKGLQEIKIDIYLPKFKLKTKYFLPEKLKNMGMLDAFSANADFSGMDGTRNLFISDVIHQAFVEVNEEGTEAAAATAVVIRVTSVLEVKEFRADHPFIFFIQDKQTNSILFLGKVVNPV